MLEHVELHIDEYNSAIDSAINKLKEFKLHVNQNNENKEVLLKSFTNFSKRYVLFPLFHQVLTTK